MVEIKSGITLKKVIDPLIVIFRLAGLWPTENPSIFYRIYGLFVLLTASILFTLTMIIQLVGFTETEDLTENSYMTLTELALCVKMINFFLRYRSMQSHVKFISDFELQNDAERKLFAKRLKLILILIVMDFVLVNTAHSSVIITVLAAPERMIGFPAWHPIDWQHNTKNYAMIFFYQLYAMTMTSNVQVVIQQFPSLMFCMVSTQMEILSMRLRSIGHKNVNEIGNANDNVTSWTKRNVESLSEEELTEISKSLVDCIDLHHRIIK